MGSLDAIIWLGIGALATLSLTFYVRRAYVTSRHRTQRDGIPYAYNPASIISLSMFAGILAALSLVIRPAPLWLHVFQLLGFATMYVLQYAVNVWLVTNKPYGWRHGYIWKAALGAGLLVIGLAICSRHNYGHIFTTDQVRPTRLYGTYYGLGLAISFVTILLIIRLYIVSIMITQDLTYRLRRGIGLCAMLCVALGTGAALVNVVLFVHSGNAYRQVLNLVFYSTVPMIVIIPFVNAVPHATLQHWTAPLARRTQQRAQHDRVWLRRLHGQLVTIAPRVALRQEALLDERLLVELTHARQVIWSYTPRTLPVSAKTEAAHIWALLRNRNVIEQSGPYGAPHPWRPSERRHLVAIARHLAHLTTPTHPGGNA